MKKRVFEKFKKNLSIISTVISVMAFIFSIYTFNRTHQLEKENQPFVMKEECKIESTSQNGHYNIQFSLKQGQIRKAYVVINHDNNIQQEANVKEVNPTVKKDKIYIPFIINSRENKEDISKNYDEDALYLYGGETNQIELIMVDTTGAKERYYILLTPVDYTAFSNDCVVEIDGEKSHSQASVTYSVEQTQPIVFQCNLINNSTVSKNVNKYNNLIEGTAVEKVDANQVYNNIKKMNELIDEQLY